MRPAATKVDAPLRLSPSAMHCAAVVVLLGLLFLPTFIGLTRIWLLDDSYSHGFLVLPLSLWLALRYLKRSDIPLEGETVLGGLSITTGCLLHLVAYVLGWFLVDFLALFFVLRGLAVTIGGRTWAGGFTFPILFLFFMFPLPVTWTSALALWLQDLVSQASAGLLDLFVVSYRRGNALFVAGVPEPLVVAEECSGLRQMVAFLALGALVGYLSGRSLWWRGTVLLLAVPAAVAANVLRVFFMAMGVKLFGANWLSSWMHDVPALITLPLGLGLLLAVGWLLGSIWPPSPKEKVACA